MQKLPKKGVLCPVEAMKKYTGSIQICCSMMGLSAKSV
jgi:hypothetical protein